MLRDGSGQWSYGAVRRDSFDNPNVQFAVLALGLAPKNNIKLDPQVWEHIALHFIQGQQETGPEVDGRIELLPRKEWDDDPKGRVTVTGKKGKKKEEKKKDKGKTAVKNAVPDFDPKAKKKVRKGQIESMRAWLASVGF